MSDAEQPHPLKFQLTGECADMYEQLFMHLYSILTDAPGIEVVQARHTAIHAQFENLDTLQANTIRFRAGVDAYELHTLSAYIGKHASSEIGPPEHFFHIPRHLAPAKHQLSQTDDQ